jgi:hypothetical protein
MVLSVRNQIRQIPERFINQTGVFKIYHDTRYGMGKFFSFRFEIILYGINQNQKNQTPINFYWRQKIIWKSQFRSFFYIGD